MHKPLLLFLTLSLLIGCTDKDQETYMSPDLAKQYFEEVKQLCDRDGGTLWGENLYGPVLLIDFPTRRVWANSGDAEGLLKERDGVFTGVYPKDRLIQTFATEYGGTLFGMVPLPREEDAYQIKQRAIHALYHSLQHRRGFDSYFYKNQHINESPARIWLLMEWEALEKAVTSQGENRRNALRDALVFRQYRRLLYPDQVQDENQFEANEGLAMYTAGRILADSAEEGIEEALNLLNRIRGYRNFEHAFGFTSGELYAWLIGSKTTSLDSLITTNTDLAEIASQLYQVSVPNMVNEDITSSLTAGYDYDEIRQNEMERLKRIKSRHARRISTYTEKPVFYMELESPNFGFDLRDPIPLDTLGSLYQDIKITDNWGKLSVSEGECLISSDLKTIRIPVKNLKTNNKNLVTDEGWELHLKNEYQVVQMDDNFFLKKRYP